MTTEPRPRRPWQGVRSRVIVGSVVLLLTAFAASILATRQMLLLRVDEQIETEMAQEVEELRALALGDDPRTGEPFGSDVAALFTIFLERNVPARDEAFYTFVGDEPYLTSFDAPVAVFEDRRLISTWVATTRPTRQDVETANGELRTLVTPLQDADGRIIGTFVVAIDPRADLDDAGRVIRTLALVALVVVLIGTAAAWSIAGRVLRPVRELTDAARDTGATDLSRRIPVDGDDELADLARTYNAMLDRLEDSFRSQRDFLDDVAHELRTPITIVRGHLEMLPDDPADRADAVTVMTDELDRMGRYVSDLLTVAKSARPDFLHVGLVDVSDLLDGVIQRGRAMAARDWVRTPGPRPGELLTEADHDRLLQALLALVSNAVQHTDDGQRIEVGAAADPTTIRLWVTDAGRGISPEDQRRIFQRFSRGAGASARPEGTGLGLAIVAAIAHAHGGDVEVDSRPGWGSTFRLLIPRTLDDHDTEEDLP